MKQRINYIEQVNSFWKEISDKDIRSIDITVYFALLDYNNTWMWKETFSCDWSIILENAKVSKNAYYASLERLTDMKLIKYEKGVRNVIKPKISIRVLKNSNTNRRRLEQEQPKEQNNEQKEKLYKLLNKETIKLINDNYELVNTNLKTWINEINIEVSIEDNNIVNEIYSIYPSKCPIKSRSLGKGEKSKTIIRKLLKTKDSESIQNSIKLYVDDCKKSNTWFKGFNSLLNDLPDFKVEPKEKKYTWVYDGVVPKTTDEKGYLQAKKIYTPFGFKLIQEL